MSRTIDINPVTRIEGHAKVHIEVGNDDKVTAAYLHVLEFRGFERFVQGMQIELMPTLTTRICGTCPHAHHIVAAKAVDKVFGVTPPKTGIMLRQLLNAGSFIHSHAVHFFALAGPDLLLGLNSPPARRNLIGLLEAAPDLAGKALRLRSLGQKICEIVGGRGTHPVTCIGGGMSVGITKDTRETLKGMANEALELAKVALNEGMKVMNKNKDLLSLLPLPTHNLGTVRDGGTMDFYDGTLRMRRADASTALEFYVEDYKKNMFEEALPFSYAKQMFFRDPNGQAAPYRVGALARINVADKIDTPLAQAQLQQFKEKCGNPCNFTVMTHFARLIELLHCAEKAVMLCNDDEIVNPNVKTALTNTPKPAVAHVEAPRGVLIHDYDVDSNGIVQGANFIVATQQNIALINASIKAMAETMMKKPEEELLNSIEFAIRCYDPCLSCATHQAGRMPLEVVITQDGRELRHVRR